MSKKLTYDHVKKYIIEKGYKLHSKEYVNSSSHLDVECSEGHMYKVSWNKFKSGRRCPHCRKRFNSVEEVKRIFEENNCLMIDDKYKNLSIPVNYICECGEKGKISVSNFLQGKRCQKCKIRKCRESKLRYTPDFVREFMFENNCVLLSDDFKTVKDRIRYLCSCGVENETTLEGFLMSPNHCNNCKGEVIAKKQMIPYETVKELVENNNCKFITDRKDYVGGKEIDYICECGNKSKATIWNFLKGIRCTDCGNEKRKKTNVEKYGTEYIFQSEEFIEKSRITMYKRGNAPVSRQQKYIHDITKGELNYPFKNYSLDIAFPEKKIYLECDFGGHWLQIKLGIKTQEEFDKDERKRWYSLYRDGWKEIRIISKTDKVPSKVVVNKMIKFANEYLMKGHSWIKFDLDKGTVYGSSLNESYDFGEIKPLRK